MNQERSSYVATKSQDALRSDARGGSTMLIAFDPETPLLTAPTSPTSPANTDDFINYEKSNVKEDITEKCDKKYSQNNFSDISSKHRKKDERPQLVQRIDDHPRGYPQLAAFVNSDENFLIARKFDFLRIRVLLYLQDELSVLERDLIKLVTDDAKKRADALMSNFGKKVAKIKRGLPGFIDGYRTSALADTGTAKNIISAAFAQERGLVLKEKAVVFRLGNSERVRSAGTVNLRWAFAEKPTELYDIVCHVLPQCAYDFILGSQFLKATETFSKHCRRFAPCTFSVFNVFHLNFLDGGRQTIDGKVGGYQVFATPDTGAERNVMDLGYAEELGFKISGRPEDRGFLQFADGTFQETVGQVNTTWTFTCGLKVPVTFEVLENCSADVILGEDLLWEYNVFQTYAASIQDIPYENEDDELFDLAPFSYERKWERKAASFKRRIMSKFKKRAPREDPNEDENLEQTLERYEAEERHHRKQWNHQYGFEGVNASPAEKEAEARRRRRYDARIEAFRKRPPCPGQSAPLISSIPTAPNSALVTSQEPERASHVTYSTPNAATSTPVHSTTTSTSPRRTRPVIPSIPTARVHLNNSH